MVRKKLALAILAFSALQADFASALGLGNLSIKSTLNQPLSAEIKLLDTTDLDAAQIKIQLATPEDFQNAGVDRDYFLTNLKFSIEMDGKGGGTLRITTREPVVEPYLNFVLEARWPSGRLLREYAMLLDPPTFSAKTQAPVAPAAATALPTVQKTKRAPASVEPPKVTSEPAPASSQDVSNELPAATTPGEYRIQVSDTLSKIASRHKPASDVTLQQTMLAIQRANPQVFIRNNVNLIKSGYILRLPSAEDVKAIAADQAATEVEEQNRAWRGGSSGVSAPSSVAKGPQLDAGTPAPAKEGNYREQARLSIATPGSSDKSSAGEGTGASAKGLEALRGQLTASQENLEKGKRENRELQSRLDDMERQIATLQRLLSLKDDQLTALQTAKANKDAAAQAAAPAAAVATPEPTPAPETPTPAPTEPTPAPTVAAAPTPTPEVAAQPAKPATPAAQPSLIDQLTANPIYGIGAVGVLALLAGLVVMRRRKAAAEEEREALNDFTIDEDSFKFDESVDLDNARVSDDAVVNPAEVVAAPVVAAAPVEEKRAVRSETGDAIAEADIYIAYGRYQQAVDLLLTAIDAEPTRSDLRLKLLEVYLEMRNKDAFRKQFVALQGLGDAAAVAQIKDLLSSVDGVDDWLADLPHASSNGAATAFAVVGGAAALAASNAYQAPASKADDLDLDLDLDFDDDKTVMMPAAKAPAPALDLADDDDFQIDDSPVEKQKQEEPDLEFDLDLDEPSSGGLELEGADDLTDLSFDLESTQPAAPAAPVSSNVSSFANRDEELELDLGDDDLDLALSEMGEAGDLEDLASALGDSNGGKSAAMDDFTADLNKLSADFDLDSSGDDLAELGELDDLGADDFSAPEPAPAPVYTPPPVAAAPAPTPAPMHAPAAESSGDDFDFLADADEVATKLDLARAYIDMGDTDGAKDILDEVLQEGTDTQKQEASGLLSRIA